MSLQQVAKELVARGKGLLAADERTTTIKERLFEVGVVANARNRREYREMLLTTPEIEKYLSGVILFEETFEGRMSSGQLFREYLWERGIKVGIKVDKGAKELAFFPGEKVTEGLDGLRERVKRYEEMGAAFAKWRAVVTIGEGRPTEASIRANAHALARYAALCQEGGLVPIVEPEVLMVGDHSLEKCEEVTGLTLEIVFAELERYRVDLQGMLLKPNMVIAGKEAKKQATEEEVAEATLRCLRQYVPQEVPGIVFLSGGQSPERATKNLNEINKRKGEAPWELSFSFGRALQKEALVVWKGKEEKIHEAQEQFLKRLRQVALAREGKL